MKKWWDNVDGAGIAIGCVIVATILATIFIIWLVAIHAPRERAEFMEYCQSKGYSEQDCRWEYKRMESRNAPTIMPIILGR
jgi:hypothetical protein